MNIPKECPKCKANLVGNEIPEGIRHLFGSDYYYRVIGVEDPRVYDGVTKWRCPDCGYEWDRIRYTPYYTAKE